MKKIFRTITCNRPGKLVKPIIWNTLASLSYLLPFLCLAQIVNKIYEYFITGELQKNTMWMFWGLMIVCFIVTFIFENIACKATYRDGYMASADSRVRLAEHIRKLPMGFLMSKDIGEIGNTMMNDISQTETAMTHVLPQIVSGAVVAVIASVGLIIDDWRMGLAIFAGFPIALLIMFGMQGLERKLDAKLSASKIEQANKLQEYLYGMRIIKSYNLQGDNFTKLKNACTNYRDACIKVEGSVGPLNLLSSAILRSGLSLMAIVGVYLVIGGTLEIPEFALFLLVGTRVYDPLSVAIMNYSEMMMCSMAGERVVKLLNESEMTGSKAAPNNFEISFDGVSFGYNDREVLKDISAVMPQGKMTALVGPSGSGKSTMLKLIARFYDPNSGSVMFGGEDEKAMDPEKLMQKMSMVFQDVYLFQDTIANNIKYGNENATQQEIEQAARSANCFEFIQALPEGFNTMIGEGGSTLSGGEKQRISIARAILKDAQVVLLDEATSSLDPENESEIQQAISQLVKGRTVIVVAHRLKTISNADNILVLENGYIVEQGTHNELLSQNGLYAKLWNLQTFTEGWKIKN